MKFVYPEGESNLAFLNQKPTSSHPKEGKWCSNHSWERKQLSFPLFPFPKQTPKESHNYKKGEILKKQTENYKVFCYN